MNVPLSIRDQLRSDGHDAVPGRDRAASRMTDFEVFAIATQESRALVTFDLDFGELVGLAGKRGVGVLLLRLRRVQSSHIHQRIRVALAEAGNALATGAIVLVDDSRIRIRSMPPTP
ncbi:MAG: DUF5615 family PIN-like protein [Acetobacteraceae bacterium]